MIQSTSKQIILCADDYGQNVAISEGIVNLAEQKRINAISCMVNIKSWSETSTALHSIQSSTFIGLHLNFTHGEALSASWRKAYGTQLSDITSVLKNTCLKRLNPQIISAEIQAQLDVFTKHMNASPDFIDGHQHVHQLPVIRDALLALYSELPFGTFIRKTCNGWSDLLSRDGFPKRQLLMLLGGMVLQRRLAQQSIPCNSSFSGIYNFKHAEKYARFFKQFLANTQDEGLIMCHPGNPSADMSDPLHSFRHHELNYFMSDDYLNDLAKHSFQLRRKA